MDRFLNDNGTDSSFVDRLTSNADVELIEDKVKANGWSDNSVLEPLRNNGWRERSDVQSFAENNFRDESNTEAEQIGKGRARLKTYLSQPIGGTQNTNRHWKVTRSTLWREQQMLARRLSRGDDGGDFQNRQENDWQDSIPVHSNQHNENSTYIFASSELGVNKHKDLDPYDIVNFLSQQKNFCSNTQTILDKFGTLQSVMSIIVQNSHIFHVKGQALQLKPNLLLCSDYFSSKDCLQQFICCDLHICKGYILNKCNDDSCIMGHNVLTEHNSRALIQFCMEKLEPSVIHSILQSILTRPDDLQALEVCEEYNIGNCKDSNCGALHVCIDYIAGSTDCCRPNCTLNHNLQRDNCFRILNSHGINIYNSSEYDVLLKVIEKSSKLVDLVQAYEQSGHSYSQASCQTSADVLNKSIPSCPQLNQVSTTIVSENAQHSIPLKHDAQNAERSVQRDNYNVSGISLSPKADNSIQLSPLSRKHYNTKHGNASKRHNIKNNVQLQTNASQRHNIKNYVQQQTIWFDVPKRNIKIPEVCYYSVTGTCRYEEHKCDRFHANQYYHWQISEDGSKWINLPMLQVNALEHAYCDPAQDNVSMPPLGQRSFDTTRHLLSILGRGIWKAEFQAMVLVNSDQADFFQLKRLCTEKIHGHNIKSNNFHWFFLDKNSKWVEYGKVDTTGQSDMVSNVTSSDIEQHFISSPNTPLRFRSSNFTYILNFNGMFQRNLNTRVRHEVRRRPELDHQVQKVQSSLSFNSVHNDMHTLLVGGSNCNLPSSWVTMQPKERIRRVILSTPSAEYQKVVGLLSGNASFRNVTKVERIQNPCLWRAFQNKVQDMSIIYGDISKVDIRQLFHGTRHDVVDSIINENFDWRLHGTSTGQSHGQGTYFSTDASESLGYSKPNTLGSKCLFIASVAVGSITRGDSSMTRPPINPATNAPYDSTGSGSIIVKYDKQEYYPEYLITLGR